MIFHNAFTSLTSLFNNNLLIDKVFRESEYWYSELGFFNDMSTIHTKEIKVIFKYVMRSSLNILQWITL